MKIAATMKSSLRINCCLMVMVAFALGCSTPKIDGEQPPRYAKSVQVAVYDPTPRAINPNFQVFPDARSVNRPHKIIALVGRNAKIQDEGLMMTAITWRARQLGADAMIVLPPIGGGFGFTALPKFAVGGPTEPTFRAHAIVYTP